MDNVLDSQSINLFDDIVDDLSLHERDPVKTKLYRYLTESTNNRSLELVYIFKRLNTYKDNSNAMYFIGYMYHQGIGVNPDYKKACKYYRKAVELNNMEAMLMLGNLYRKGLGVERVDYKQAYYLYENSLSLGNKRALVCLADLYDKGDGVERSKERAIKLYKRAVKELEVDSPNYSGILLSLSCCYHMCNPLISENILEIEKATKYLYRAVQLGNKTAESQLRGIVETHGFILIPSLYYKINKLKENISKKEEMIGRCNRQIDQLNKQIIELSYRPGGPGYIEAEEHFKEILDEEKK